MIWLLVGVVGLTVVVLLVVGLVMALREEPTDEERERVLFEFDPHRWVRVPQGTIQSGGVPFRFCDVCDREEYDTGEVYPGYLVNGGECE